MVPMLTCGLVRSNFAFATGVLLWTSWFVRPPPLAADLVGGSCGRYSLRPGARSPSRDRRGSLPGGLRDDLLRHVLRNLGVGVELHRVARPGLGLRPQVADVAEHPRQRHQGADDAGA